MTVGAFFRVWVLGPQPSTQIAPPRYGSQRPRSALRRIGQHRGEDRADRLAVRAGQLLDLLAGAVAYVPDLEPNRSTQHVDDPEVYFDGDGELSRVIPPAVVPLGNPPPLALVGRLPASRWRSLSWNGDAVPVPGIPGWWAGGCASTARPLRHVTIARGEKCIDEPVAVSFSILLQFGAR